MQTDFLARTFFLKRTAIRLTRTGKAFLTLAILLNATGCIHRHLRPTAPPAVPPPAPQVTPRPSTPPSAVQGEEGIASWYGPGFNGKSTASGEIYNMDAMTAAHRTLPFGTRVRVHDLENGQSVVVRINDRGPFVAGRIIDLSRTAAQELHMPGTALVRLEILGLGSNPENGIYAVQVGAFLDERNADHLKRLIEPRFGPVTVDTFDRGDGLFHRVRVGRVPNIEDAEALAKRLREANLATQTFTVRLN